jgi:heat shock protein HslJ
MKALMTGAALILMMAACATQPPGATPGTGEGAAAGAPLEGTSWTLVELNGAPVSAGPRTPTLTFGRDDARAYGTAGCNQFSAGYTRSGSSLRFTAPVSTRMACVEEGVMRREADYLNALQATEQYQMSGGTLILSGGGRTLARFLAGSGS